MTWKCFIMFLSKVFDMVNHTKLIRALTLSALSNNTKRWLSAYTKKDEQPVADTTLLLPLLSCQSRGPSGRIYIPYPIQLLCLHITPVR